MAGRVNWQTVAAQLATALPIERLHPAARTALEVARGRWVIALSGGSDSVALALLVWAHWPQRRGKLVLAHFNHRLRGRDSAHDARFCAALAKGLGVEFVTEAWADAPTQPSEATARAVRQQFLARLARQRRARWVLTGHQRDDIAESMLMRLARGSGSAGLAAPRPVQTGTKERPGRIRPLLDLTRSELSAALKAAGGRWREDESNASDRYFRNRVRAVVIPAWQTAAGRDAVAGAALSRARLEEDDRALEAWVDEIAPLAERGRLDLRKLAGKPDAVWRRALQRWLTAHAERGDLSRQGFADLLRVAQAGRTTRFSLGQQGFVRVRRGWLWFESS